MPNRELLVSVVIPHYNQQKVLVAALESVLKQRRNVDVIVIDDGSTESPEQVCRAHGDRVRLIRQENSGVSVARNRGIQESRGAFLIFLDADDRLDAGFIEAAVSALTANPDWDVAMGGTTLTELDGTPTPVSHPAPYSGRMFPHMASWVVVHHSSCMFRRGVVERTGKFDPSLRFCEDWDFLLQISRTGAYFGRLEQNAVLYRISPTGASHNPIAVLESGLEVLKRSRAPDPRVASPAPEFANGAPMETLRSDSINLSATALGKSIGLRNLVAAKAALAYLVGFLEKRPLDQIPRDVMFRAAATSLQIFPPDPAEVAKGCFETLVSLWHESAADDVSRQIVWQCILAIFGTSEVHTLQRRLEILEKGPMLELARRAWRKLRLVLKI